MVRTAIVVALMLFLPQDVIRKSSSGGSVVIQWVKRAPKGGPESVLQFRGAKGEQLCTVDYSSRDGNHGYRVERSEWTRDGRFFVWSMESTGGHQPWHRPTMFFDATRRDIKVVDEFVDGPGITSSQFQLSGEDEIEVYVSPRVGDTEPKLSRLSLLRIAKSNGRRLWTCTGGKTIHP